jgi:choline kinase
MSASTVPESTASARTSLVLPAPAQAPNGLGPVPLGDDDQSVKLEVERLRREARAWRGFNSAQWVLWGIVQAKVPTHLQPKELDAEASNVTEDTKTTQEAVGLVAEEEQQEDDEDGFDYLGYSRERAAFFWGDILSLGIMSEKELPEQVGKTARIVDY